MYWAAAADPEVSIARGERTDESGRTRDTEDLMHRGGLHGLGVQHSLCFLRP